MKNTEFQYEDIKNTVFRILNTPKLRENYSPIAIQILEFYANAFTNRRHQIDSRDIWAIGGALSGYYCYTPTPAN